MLVRPEQKGAANSRSKVSARIWASVRVGQLRVHPRPIAGTSHRAPSTWATPSASPISRSRRAAVQYCCTDVTVNGQKATDVGTTTAFTDEPEVLRSEIRR